MDANAITHTNAISVHRAQALKRVYIAVTAQKNGSHLLLENVAISPSKYRLYVPFLNLPFGVF